MTNLAQTLWPILLSNGTSLLQWLAIYTILFLPLTYLFPGNRSQPLVRRDMTTDLVFFCLTPVYPYLQAPLQTLFANGYAWLAATAGGVAPEFSLGLSSLPFPLQILMILALTDFLQYWTHRFSHDKPLWKLHAIHHSSKDVDWLSSVRWHPLNILYHVTLTQACVWSLGFNERVFPLVLLINGINGTLVHANLNWTYGPLRYVIASPVYHRWHHTHPSQGGNKNFAPFFSFFDLIFGTFYMPQGVPMNFGAPYDDVPEHAWGQLLYPFRKTSTNPAPASQPRLDGGA